MKEEETTPPKLDASLLKNSKKLPAAQCPRLMFFIHHAEERIRITENLLAKLVHLLQALKNEIEM